jgi:hypothetical protein
MKERCRSSSISQGDGSNWPEPTPPTLERRFHRLQARGLTLFSATIDGSVYARRGERPFSCGTLIRLEAALQADGVDGQGRPSCRRP